ncbi:hypothetical protein KKH82_03975 [Patescibacteria group bacterium]|nr:hypothetical protein [Patescibacteria group bacterium]
MFWAYIRLFNQDLGAKLSYCLMSSTQIETVDYEADILLINQQLIDINDKVENILQTL